MLLLPPSSILLRALQVERGLWGSFCNPSVISGECEDLAGRLKSSRQRVGELEKTLSAVSTQQKQVEKVSPLPFRPLQPRHHGPFLLHSW